ncbi:hypothetical protein TNCV_2180211 [Trichonephila clavipes]|uniref:Uncharacterized protein n=1 Tax=Trichonephila clavipes TaxID=2585209 RepID=A0A8X6VUP4_TRICX|nr:hypothetical protein TNCV_2180211 [Trichonephila clavipes]
MKLAPKRRKLFPPWEEKKVLESSSEELTFEPHIHTIALASTKRCVSWGSEEVTPDGCCFRLRTFRKFET